MKSAARLPSASANDVRLLCCGAEYFPALITAIQAAIAEIQLETYIFADDVTGRKVA